MTDELIIRMRHDREQKQAANVIQYHAMAGKLVADGKLSPGDEKKFQTAIEAIGLDLAAVESDLAVLRRASQLAEIASTADSARVEQAELHKIRGTFEQEAAVKADEINKRRAGIATGQVAAANRLLKATEAASSLKELRSAHWQLFEAEDPCAAARKRHLVADLFNAEGSRGEYSVVAIEQVMEFPLQHAGLTAMDPADFVPLGTQTRDEVDQLLATVHTLTQDDRQRPARYVLGAEDEQRIKRGRGVVLVQDPRDLNIYQWKEGRWCYQFIPAPGQTAAQLDRLLGELLRQLCFRADGQIWPEYVDLARKKSRTLLKSQPAAVAVEASS
ncbi:MAG TPA: hypothetical protein VK797_03145 [Tepidisphaeraceae bacterium]|jgi:hypothetical protein|nr:hypothetical protein [Tepidisphaeraceae bacterium]